LPARQLAGQVAELGLHVAEHRGDAVDEALDQLHARTLQYGAEVTQGIPRLVGQSTDRSDGLADPDADRGDQLAQSGDRVLPDGGPSLREEPADRRDGGRRLRPEPARERAEARSDRRPGGLAEVDDSLPARLEGGTDGLQHLGGGAEQADAQPCTEGTEDRVPDALGEVPDAVPELRPAFAQRAEVAGEDALDQAPGHLQGADDDVPDADHDHDQALED